MLWTNAGIIRYTGNKFIPYGTSEDVAKMVAYFSGEASSFMTGAENVMVGGMS